MPIEQVKGVAYWAAAASIALGVATLALSILPVTSGVSYVPAYVGLFIGFAAAITAAVRREKGVVEAVAGCTFCGLRLLIAGYLLILSGNEPSWFRHW